MLPAVIGTSFESPVTRSREKATVVVVADCWPRRSVRSCLASAVGWLSDDDHSSMAVNRPEPSTQKVMVSAPYIPAPVVLRPRLKKEMKEKKEKKERKIGKREGPVIEQQR